MPSRSLFRKMQPAPKKLKTDGAMTRVDWDFWENEVVHGAAGQVHLVKQWPAGDSPETPIVGRQSN